MVLRAYWALDSLVSCVLTKFDRRHYHRAIHTRTSAARGRVVLDLKANDVVVLDLQGVTDMTDYFVIASGTSDTHVRSIAEHVIDEMKKEGTPLTMSKGCSRAAGCCSITSTSSFTFSTRRFASFYQLERLWSDAEVVAVDAQGALK